MWKKFVKRLQGKQEGITGLETAIILIAFVIVASVFAYVVLSAGLFSSQKTKEAINGGLQSTMSTLEIKGNVIAKMNEDGVATNIYFSVGVPAAGNPVDFSATTGNTSSKLMVISYSDANNLISKMEWTIEKLSTINDDDILDPTELFCLDVIMPTSGNFTLGAYNRFSIEMKPADGPTLVFERTIPARISAYVNLH
jgi:flagellin FlaB